MRRFPFLVVLVDVNGNTHSYLFSRDARLTVSKDPKNFLATDYQAFYNPPAHPFPQPTQKEKPKRKLAPVLLMAGLVLLVHSMPGAEKPNAEKKDRQSGKLRVQRLDEFTEEDLSKNLLRAPEVGLDPFTASSNTLIADIAKAIEDGKDEVMVGNSGESLSLKPLVKADLALNLAPRLMLDRRDLAGLGFRLGLACRVGLVSLSSVMGRRTTLLRPGPFGTQCVQNLASE
jgi:hypothetical protein